MLEIEITMQPAVQQGQPDLDFAGHDTLYATHGLHAYAAKCPPQLARFGISEYSLPGDTILDPMCGSGTTLVESRLLGRSALGFDLDPLACLIARVKSSDAIDAEIGSETQIITERVEEDLTLLRGGDISDDLRLRATAPEFPRRDYWFQTHVSEALALLSFHIAHSTAAANVKDFLWLAFSSVILSKVSVANARDIIHSRHHYFEHEAAPDVLGRFRTRVKIMRKQLVSFQTMCAGASAIGTATVYHGDARHLPIEKESINLVLTSPPYATALDYPRAHFLAVAWMQPVLGVTITEYMAKAPDYIGSERGRVKTSFSVEPQLARLPSAQSAIELLSAKDTRQAHLIQRYFLDMQSVIGEMSRVLKAGGHLFIVVCPSHVRRVQVPTHAVFTEMAQVQGLEFVRQYERTINSNRRVLPYMREAFGERMNTEYVLIYRKA